MASGINFNPSTRLLTGGGSTVSRSQPSEEVIAQNPIDGFQPFSYQFATQTQTLTPSEPGVVDFRVSRDQLTSAAFQQTLSTLASSGHHVTITVIAASEAVPDVQSYTQTLSSAGLEDRFGNFSHTVKPQTF